MCLLLPTQTFADYHLTARIFPLCEPPAASSGLASWPTLLLQSLRVPEHKVLLCPHDVHMIVAAAFNASVHDNICPNSEGCMLPELVVRASKNSADAMLFDSVSSSDQKFKQGSDEPAAVSYNSMAENAAAEKMLLSSAAAAEKKVKENVEARKRLVLRFVLVWVGGIQCMQRKLNEYKTKCSQTTTRTETMIVDYKLNQK